MNYLSSFFFVPQDRPSTTRTDSVSASNADVLKVFSNCTNYLMEQGEKGVKTFKDFSSNYLYDLANEAGVLKVFLK